MSSPVARSKTIPVPAARPSDHSRVFREAPERGRDEAAVDGEHAVQVPSVSVAVGLPDAAYLTRGGDPDNAVRNRRDGDERLSVPGEVVRLA